MFFFEYQKRILMKDCDDVMLDMKSASYRFTIPEFTKKYTQHYP